MKSNSGTKPTSASVRRNASQCGDALEKSSASVRQCVYRVRTDTRRTDRTNKPKNSSVRRGTRHTQRPLQGAAR